jgi:putative chitinase
MIDRSFFFQSIKPELFPTLSQSQVDGINHILDGWERSYAANPIEFLAYSFATTIHETAKTMQPIREYGGDAYFLRMYDIQGSRPDLAKSLGNVNPGDGVRYAGKGLLQVTGRSNYRKMGAICGADLESNPELALDPTIAVKILFEGMLRGSFTGKRFADYLPHDPVGARRIINGTDKAELIAGYHAAFLGALKVTADRVAEVAPASPAPSPTPTIQAPAPGFWSRVHAALSRKA